MTSYTQPLTEAQAEQLRNLLAERGYAFSEKPHALFSASKDKANVTVYAKGPKVLVQGKGTTDFVRFLLEPEILGEARLGYEELHQPEMFSPHIGVDESGKGEFFGPVVIAGVYVDAGSARSLMDAGIMDSKRITSDARIRDLATAIRETPDVRFDLVSVAPPRYNELYRSFGNLNKLLAWGHAKVIENLLVRIPDCPRALSDQFANPRVLERALQERGSGIEIEQKTKAESDVAVAAASILARERFIDWLRDRGEALDSTLPRGASAAVRRCARDLVATHGAPVLETVAKTHFKTAAEVLDES